jgi:hypothetical protein
MVDRLYRHLIEIHAIGTTQLAEFAWWCRSVQDGLTEPRQVTICY